MQIGIIGLSLSGKSTLFRAMTGAHALASPSQAGKGQFQVATIKVPDPRLERLVEMFDPEKITPASVEYLDFPGPALGSKNPLLLTPQTREVDALAVVIRAFEEESVPHPLKLVNVVRDLEYVEAELILADLQIIENRIERVRKGLKKGDKSLLQEAALLERCHEALQSETQLAQLDLTAEEQRNLRGFQLFTLKPRLILLNVGEDELSPEAYSRVLRQVRPWEEKAGFQVAAVCAKLEAEIVELPEAERGEFLREMGIERPALEKVITLSYELVGLISFFTVGKDEVKAWTIPSGTPAVRAAGVIHSDLERGFIRGEVIFWEDLLRAGSLAAARDQGLLRIEGKNYVVRDGDVLHVRFNL